MKKLGFIGVGNMAAALINGIKNSVLAESVSVFAFDLKEENLQPFSGFVTPCASIGELVEKCEYILLAVKPQNMDVVLPEIKPNLSDDKVIISIAAGISADFIRSKTTPSAKVVQVMPNTPALLGLGASALGRGEGVSDEEFAFAKSVLESCGIAEEVPLDKMNEIIAINGSSPAFVYLFAKGFVDYASEVGIDSDTALKLFAKTLEGSAAMLTNSGMTVEQLIKQVSSPGGTTVAGLAEFDRLDLVGIVKKAAEACTNRAYELQGK